MCCCLLFGLWRFVVCFDDWLIKYVKPFHNWFFECIVRTVLPGFPAPRPTCEFFTYFCLIIPVEYYRTITCRQTCAVHRLTGEVFAFFFKQFDVLDIEEIAGALDKIPDWKKYMLTGKWPWSEEKEEGNDDDETSEQTSDDS
ncbi:hypothetical protein MN116_003359 [Schistosoma mekongi]|uniref:Uncharacterized protein n=1 Tax=Schistosoma mekongi TaxID=38744 RepID=A0AAE1ZHT8_SCHME|nr:hypothetical protein MN116_003359 [Schistosoma mekongi]